MLISCVVNLFNWYAVYYTSKARVYQGLTWPQMLFTCNIRDVFLCSGQDTGFF